MDIATLKSEAKRGQVLTVWVGSRSTHQEQHTAILARIWGQKLRVLLNVYRNGAYQWRPRTITPDQVSMIHAARRPDIVNGCA